MISSRSHPKIQSQKRAGTRVSAPNGLARKGRESPSHSIRYNFRITQRKRSDERHNPNSGNSYARDSGFSRQSHGRKAKSYWPWSRRACGSSERRIHGEHGQLVRDGDKKALWWGKGVLTSGRECDGEIANALSQDDPRPRDSRSEKWSNSMHRE